MHSEHIKLEKVNEWQILKTATGRPRRAAHDFLSLPPYYQFEGRVTVPDSFSELFKLHNKTNFRMWARFHEALPDFTKLDLPAIEPVPVDELILMLQGLRRV